MKKETRIIKQYLKKIGASKIKVRCGKYETQADMEQNIIYFNPKDFEDKKFNKIIKGYYKSIGHKIKVEMATYGILHELGHILSKMEIKNLYKELNTYLKGKNNLPKLASDKVRFYKYRKLHIEKLADKYAYIVYKKFEKQSINLNKKLQKVAK
jgi:hypothetical protein